MGFFRALIQANPHSMSGGFYSSSWKTKEEYYGYLRNIRFNSSITSLNITNSIPNSRDLSDANHPDFPVFGTGANNNSVNGINISNYDKLYLNSNCYRMFYNCQKCTDWSGLSLFDWTYVTDYSSMFYSCYHFNQPVTIGQNVTNCRSMFHMCNNFNQPVTIIGNNVTDCSIMFSRCYNFNQPVTIGNNVTNCLRMFEDCYNFNQPVTIGNNVTNCSNMFMRCNNFNQPVTIGNNVTDCLRMFESCINFNQPVTIGPNVTNCSNMFIKCKNFRSSVIIGSNVNNCSRMFWDYYSSTTSTEDDWNHAGIPVGDIYIKGSNSRLINVAGMLSRQLYNSITGEYTANNGYRLTRVNIYFNNTLQNQFNKTTTSTSLMGVAMTWTAMENGRGYYNARSNIYLFNDYEG